jgi:hypothetical protein
MEQTWQAQLHGLAAALIEIIPTTAQATATLTPNSLKPISSADHFWKKVICG